jgi:hypothetical protein
VLCHQNNPLTIVTHAIIGLSQDLHQFLLADAVVIYSLLAVCCVLLQVLLVLLLSCFSWRLAPRMGGPAGVLSQVVAALELRVAQGMWLTPEPRSARTSSTGV